MSNISFDDHKNIVAEFISQMNSQDNHCTATPYYFCIRSRVYGPSYHEEDYDRLAAVNDDGLIDSDESINGLCKKLVENELLTDSDLMDEDGDELDDFDLRSMLEDKKIQVFSEKAGWEESGVFFTETDAKNHLERNSHHYSADAHTYVKHCFRAPELEQFFKSVGVLAGVEYQSR